MLSLHAENNSRLKFVQMLSFILGEQIVQLFTKVFLKSNICKAEQKLVWAELVRMIHSSAIHCYCFDQNVYNWKLKH